MRRQYVQFVDSSEDVFFDKNDDLVFIEGEDKLFVMLDNIQNRYVAFSIPQEILLKNKDVVGTDKYTNSIWEEANYALDN